jgi:hypothetical protein
MRPQNPAALPATPDLSRGAIASNQGSVTGDVMTTDKTRDLIDLRGQDKKVLVAQQGQQSQSGAAIRRAPSTTPVRRPLFGR